MLEQLAANAFLSLILSFIFPGIGFTGFFGKFTGLKLAEGGLAFGPSLAMVGDNPNARTDPEVIAPLSRLTDIVGSGTRTIIVKGRLVGEGRHIVGVIEDQLEFEER